MGRVGSRGTEAMANGSMLPGIFSNILAAWLHSKEEGWGFFGVSRQASIV